MIRQASHLRVMALKTKAEEEARKLKGEIDEAKKRQGALLRRTRQEAQKLCKEKRDKELEAVRLRRNESRIKYELEKTKEVYAKQEAVLRRKLEEAHAVQQRNLVSLVVRGMIGVEACLGREGVDKIKLRHHPI
jgi:actin-related protein